MTSHNEHFRPESIEEQLNSLEPITPPFADNALPDVHMVHDLRQVYTDSTQAGERVWTRLAEHIAQQNEASNTMQLPTNTIFNNERSIYMQPPQISIRQTQQAIPKRMFTQIISVLVAAVLIGSVLWLLVIHTHLNIGSSTTSPGHSQTTHGGSTSSPVLYDLTLHGLYALDANSGRQLWHNATVNAGNTPIVSGNAVYVDDGNTLYALDALRGTLLWKFAHGGQPQDSSDTNSKLLLGHNSIYLVEGTDVFGSAGLQPNQIGGQSGIITPAPSILFALDPATGNVRWQHTLSYRLNDPVIDGDVIYGIGSTATNGALYALKDSDGSVLWQQTLASSKLYYGLLAASDTLYFASTTDAAKPQTLLYALALSNGEERWQSLPIYATAGYPITVAGNVLYYNPGSPKLYAFNAQNGLFLWTYTASTLISDGVHPVANGQIYFVTQQGLNDPPYTLQAVNASSGTHTWSRQLSLTGTAITSLIVRQDHLYVYSNDNSSIPNKMTIVDPTTSTPIKSYALPTDAGISKLVLGA